MYHINYYERSTGLYIGTHSSCNNYVEALLSALAENPKLVAFGVYLDVVAA